MNCRSNLYTLFTISITLSVIDTTGKNNPHTSLILKTAYNCSIYVSLAQISSLAYEWRSSPLRNVFVVLSGVLCLSRNTPWSSWPTWSTSASAPTSTKRPDRNSSQLLMTLTDRKDKQQQTTHAECTITMEICYNYNVISLQYFTPDIRLLPLYIFVWM